MPKLDTDYGSFKALISAQKIYTVPPYQRRYSWAANKQVAELWGDVVRLYRERASLGNPLSTHFIGSVVVGETEDRALGPGKCNIIDGQQRLITLSIIVAAIRDTLVDDPSARTKISTNYLEFPETGQPRLVLSQDDDRTYRAILRRDADVDRKSPLYRAYTFIHRQLQTGFVDDTDPDDPVDDSTDSVVEGLSAESGEDEPLGDEPVAASGASDSLPWDWTTLLEVLSRDLELVSISGVPAERAYQIFATLNHAGLKLTQVDLIRNAVFMQLPKRNVEAHQSIWQPLEARLGERGVGKFLHAWVVRRGHNVPQKDTYASMLQELKTAGPTEAHIYGLLEDLRQESQVFQLVNDSSSYEAQKLARSWRVPESMLRSLQFLAAWGNVPAQPLLMEIITRWHGGGVKGAAATRLVHRVESLLSRRFIAQIPPNDLRSTLARLVVQARDVADGAFESKILEGLREPTRRWPDDTEITDALITRALYRPKNISQTFLILRSIAESIEGKECPHVELGRTSTKYSVEHILPQTPQGTTWFDDMTSWGDDDPHLTWNTRRHTIGNLTLTAYNTELSNNSFEDKQAWIRDRLRLQLSTKILEQDVWTRNQIESRSAELASIAIKVWPSPESKR